jgi:hypothetical protein
VADPVNLFPDLTRQALNPVTPGVSAPGIAAARPSGSLTPEIGRPGARLESRFGNGLGSGLGGGSAASGNVERETAPSSSKVFKSRVAIEMPTRRF